MKLLLKTILFSLASFIAFAQLPPKKLLIYYGWPSSINGGAVSVFANYDYIILGDGLELPSHGDNIGTKSILANSSLNNVKFFGYIDLGNSQNLSMTEIQNRISLWKAMGSNVKGIFFDEYGYDYGVSRQRQNDAVNYAHGLGLQVIANAWIPDDVFGSIVSGSNPNGIAPTINSNDFYLSESYLIETGNYQSATTWKTKAESLRNYQNTMGFKILSITTNASSNTFDSNKFHYAWYGAVLYNHEATGWGEFNFGASDANVPFRSRPSVSLGTVYNSTVQVQNTEHYRFTNLGKCWINTSNYTFGFTTYSVCTSNVSNGLWGNNLSWDCGRVPLPTDDVVIKSGHKMTVNISPALCRKFLVEQGGVFIGNVVFESKANRTN